MKKVKLPIIGQVWISKEQPIKQIIEKASTSLLGGLVEFSGGKLSNNKTISTKLLEANTGWVYSNNDAIAQEVSKIEFELYTIGLSKGEIVYNEVKSHPLLTLLDKPNEETTKNDCIYITQSHKKLAGDSFWLKIRNGQQITSVRILQPDKITLILKDPTPENPNAVVGYKYEDVIDGQTIKITYPPEDIIHYKKPNPNNQFRGIGVVETLKETIDLDNLTTNTTINYFLNGAIQNFALTTESKITDEQLKRLKGEIRSSISGQKNAFNVPIFGGGMKPVDISYSNKDMEFLSQLEWYRDKIMVGFGNTKASLGIIDDVNRASHESSITSWLKSTVKPDMEAIVNTLNEYLVPEFGENLVLGFCDPVPEDRTSDITEVKDLYPAGVITLNEAREIIDVEPIKGGDVLANNGLTAPEKPPEEDKTIIPPSLKSIDIKTVLRKRNVYTQQQINQNLKNQYIGVAKEILARKNKKKTVEPEKHHQFTNEQVQSYWEKQIRIIEVLEQRFEKKIEQFIGKVVDGFLDHLDQEVNKSIKKGYFDDTEALKTQAQFDFTPLLLDQAVLAGQEAYKLIGYDDVYTPYDLREQIAKNVSKFTESLLDTDRDKLVSIINNGLDEGLSVSDIRRQIVNDFGTYSKTQAELITRTEVSRVSNQASLDAFRQSGVVEGKQWVTYGAIDECADYNGKIVYDLKGDFYGDKSQFKDGDPPLHPNCKCIVLPILAGEKAYIPVENKKLREYTVELESQIDKRTKEFKELKKQFQSEKADDLAYIKALEKYVGNDDSNRVIDRN